MKLFYDFLKAINIDSEAVYQQIILLQCSTIMPEITGCMYKSKGNIEITALESRIADFCEMVFTSQENINKELVKNIKNDYFAFGELGIEQDASIINTEFEKLFEQISNEKNEKYILSNEVRKEMLETFKLVYDNFGSEKDFFKKIDYLIEMQQQVKTINIKQQSDNENLRKFENSSHSSSLPPSNRQLSRSGTGLPQRQPLRRSAEQLKAFNTSNNNSTNPRDVKQSASWGNSKEENSIQSSRTCSASYFGNLKTITEEPEDSNNMSTINEETTENKAQYLSVFKS